MTSRAEKFNVLVELFDGDIEAAQAVFQKNEHTIAAKEAVAAGRTHKEFRPGQNSVVDEMVGDALSAYTGKQSAPVTRPDRAGLGLSLRAGSGPAPVQRQRDILDEMLGQPGQTVKQARTAPSNDFLTAMFPKLGGKS